MKMRPLVFLAALLAASSCRTPTLDAYAPDSFDAQSQSFAASALYSSGTEYSLDDIRLHYAICSQSQGGTISAGTLDAQTYTETVPFGNTGQVINRAAARANVPRPPLGWSYGDVVELRWEGFFSHDDDGTVVTLEDTTRAHAGGAPYVRLRQIAPTEHNYVKQNIDSGKTLTVVATISNVLSATLIVPLRARRGGYAQANLDEIVHLTIPAGQTSSQSYSISTNAYKKPKKSGVVANPSSAGWSEQPRIRLNFEVPASFPCHETSTFSFSKKVNILSQ